MKSATKIAGYTGKAYFVEKVEPTLGVAYELEIENGVVVKKTALKQAADKPAIVLNLAQRALEKQYSDGKPNG